MRNKYKVLGDKTVIILNSKKHGRKETIIDTNKLDQVMSVDTTWGMHFAPNTGSFYCRAAVKNSNGKIDTVLLHRLVMGFPEGKVVDHINGDTLNNTTKNLREATISENLQNRSGANKNSKSGVRGVYWHKQDEMWQVKMRVNGTSKHIGLYETILEAEIAAKNARAKYMPFSNESPL